MHVVKHNVICLQTVARYFMMFIDFTGGGIIAMKKRYINYFSS